MKRWALLSIFLLAPALHAAEPAAAPSTAESEPAPSVAESALAPHSAELEQAYQKEYAYLVAEKKALEQRLKTVKESNRQNLKQVGDEIESAQQKFLTQQNRSDRLNRQIVEASRGVDVVENDNLVLETTLGQARESLTKLQIHIDEAAEPAAQLSRAFEQAAGVLASDGTVTKVPGEFFLADGERAEGEVVKVGRVARYGVSSQGGGLLAPSGAGKFSVWNAQGADLAKSVANNNPPAMIDIFLYDSADKAVDRKEEKHFSDEVEAGGLVGKVIIALGIAGVLLVGVRLALLWMSSANFQQLIEKVNLKVEDGDLDGAVSTSKEYASSASKVIAATLRNLDRDRDHIEDIISENILNESSRIDRFGTAILVIAAVSPLLGLLGTVTGMISTFDIITEFGTGDPKLLSSGISEALITTKFGLVVAIPLLLTGNLLTSWAHGIKNDLEQAALHIVNTHMK